MPGLLFEDQAPASASHPNRTDVALFVGFVCFRIGSSIPGPIQRWLNEAGWTSKPYARPIESLLNLPVPIENWSRFDQLFAWEQRTSGSRDGSTYLGAAVRSFFAQGGRKCYVVRGGDPFSMEAPVTERLQAIERLIPGYLNRRFDCSPADRHTWSGIGHLFGLPEVSFVCLPDLADATGMDRQRVPVPNPPPAAPEDFAECSIDPPPPAPDITVRDIRASRCDETGYASWTVAVNLVTAVLAERLREVQLVAALPIPDKLPLPDKKALFNGIVSTAFLQLAYPWLRTPGSEALPETLESPDGVLTGILARNALTRGTFRSAANLHVGDVFDLFPQLGREQMAEGGLIERVSLIGPTSEGLRLLSDVTLSGSESYRPGSVSRLVAAIARTARRIGEDIIFESSGERTWGQVRERLNDFLGGLFEAGALRGESASDSYQVRCDRSTMSQNDLDHGRLIASVQFDAAAPIDTVTVVLVMNEGRQMAMPASEAA
jgi:uncharacterized protein